MAQHYLLFSDTVGGIIIDCVNIRLIDYVSITRLRTYHNIPNSLKSNHQKTNFFLTEYLIPAEFLYKINKNKAAIKASFQVAHLLAKQGKSFRDEFIKL